MAVYNEADFVMQGREVQDPEIAKDELELYYDVKGKKNGDVHKDKLLDMSGQGKDGELSGFDYDGELSGYDEDGGLVFNGIDDKLVRADVDNIEVMSATRNLLPSDYFSQFSTTDNDTSESVYLELKPNTTYTMSSNLPGSTTGLNLENRHVYLETRTEKDAVFSGNPVTKTTDNNGMLELLFYTGRNHSQGIIGGDFQWQLEEGSTATPYVPYIPTAKMTYQLNNNVISYGEGGTVKWVKDGKMMERKGINLVRNGNFFDGNRDWSTYGSQTGNSKREIVNGFATIRREPNQGLVGFGYILRRIPTELGDKLYFSGEINVVSGTGGINITNQQPIVHAPADHSKTGVWQKTSNIAVANSNGSTDIILNAGSDTTGREVREAKFRNIQFINLTATFGAGNEPTLEEIQADPDKWQWLPNPMDLLEARELGGNILGDMEDIVDASPRDRQSGEEVFTEHADDSHVEVEVDGQSYQHAGSGKNLASIDGFYIGAGEIRKEKDSFILPPNSHLRIDLDVLTGKKYILSAKTNTTKKHWSTRIRDYTNTLVSLGSVYTAENNETMTFEIFNHLDAPDETIFTDIQIEEGSTATEYEPPAPTPDYPIEIESLNDFDVVSSVGSRNYWAMSKKLWHSYLIHQGDGIFTNSTTSPSFAIFRMDKSGVPVGETYTVSFEIRVSDDAIQFENAVFYINGETPSGRHSKPTLVKNKWVKVYATFDYTIENTRLVHLYIDGIPANNTFQIRNFQLEKGSTATPYTPAPEDITEDSDHPLIDKINLSLSEPLRSVGDVRDRVFRDGDGLWKIERNVGEFVIDGTESGDWFRGTSSADSDYVWFYKQQSRYGMTRPREWDSPVIMSNFKDVGRSMAYTSLTQEGFRRWTDATPFMFSMKLSRMNSFDDAGIDAWFRNNPTTVLYEMEEPIIETLGQELQDKLNTLKSFKGSNYIYTVNNTDNLHKEQLKPTLHATFNSKDYLKETRTLTNLLIWARELTDEELIHHNQLFLNRFNLPSDKVIGEPIEQTLNLLHGGMVGHSLEQNYTINI